MKGGPPPLRFLLLLLGGWTGFRVAVLLPDWEAEALHPASRPLVTAGGVASRAGCRLCPATMALARVGQLRLRQTSASRPTRQADAAWTKSSPLPGRRAPLTAALVSYKPLPATPAAPIAFAAPVSGAKRWSISAWAFLRRGGSTPLAAGGVLGGSQAGGRITYRLNRDPERPLALSVRFYTPLETRGAEAAVGAEWKPLRALPFRLLAERRQALDANGRSAFTLTVLGGASVAPGGGPMRIDAYGQAGMVGLRSRDLFADGSVEAGIAVDRDARLELGGGIWGAAQPGAARLDAGPRVRLRLPIASASASLAAEWRFRIAGNSAPRSGPALTLATDF